MKINRLLSIGFILCLASSCTDANSSNDDSEKALFRHFLALKAESRIIEENGSLDMRIYYGHNFYNDEGKMLSNPEDVKFCVTMTEGDNVVFNYVIDDFYSEEYDCIKNKTVDYKNHYVTVTFSWSELEEKNSDLIMYWVKLKREDLDHGPVKSYFRFFKKDNNYVLKLMGEE